MKSSTVPASLKEKVTAWWLGHPFYRDAIVLAVDIGLEGIGVCLRRGSQIIFARSLTFDMPKVGRLEGRRQKRAWRHCRMNRAVRMARLKKLFEKHGLPWVDDEDYSKNKPFELRDRAIKGTLASAHAVANCIRHCVSHRGYEYFSDEGQFPWGEEASLKKASQWLKSSFLGEREVAEMNAVAADLEGSPKEREEFEALFRDRVDYSMKHSVEQVIAEHVREKKTNLRLAARGHNFPRRAIESHLRAILEKHRSFIPDYEAFLAALFLKPRNAKEKNAAIFHYNRKTKEEMKELWEKKTRRCPYFVKFLNLGTTETACDKNSDPDVARWKMLEFAATRRVEIDAKTGKGRNASKRRMVHLLSAEAISDLVALIGKKDANGTAAKEIVKADIKKACSTASPVASTESPFNKDFFTHLTDLVKPSASKAKQVSSLCAVSAKALFAKATDEGKDFSREGFNERCKELYDFRKAMRSDAILYPQVEFLMGHRAANEKDPTQTLHGKLRQLFRRFHEALDGRTAPDYFIIETIGDPPRNTLQKYEWVKKRDEGRARREKLRAEGGVESSTVASSGRRLQLHDQQRGLCPFTGLELPDALSPDLEIEHLFPQSRGGLSMDENLVLTFGWVNKLKDERTPRELAADPRDREGRILPWEKMLAVTHGMKWGARRKTKDEFGNDVPDPRQCDKKHDVFAFVPSAEKPVPDFGNTTRTAQLGRQLIEEAATWMGIAGKADLIAERIGTPSGWLSAQARRSWIPRNALNRPQGEGDRDAKTRDDYRHHLVDAAVLAQIPPREGMNSVHCKGIFWTETQAHTDEATKTVSFRHLTFALPDLGPPMAQLEPLLRPEPEECPVEKHRPRKIGASLGDSTFWRLDEKTGSTYQREPLNIEKTKDAEELLGLLRMMKIPPQKIPSREHLRKWLDTDPTSRGQLRLLDGTPVRNVWKKGKKQTLKSPLGWSGRQGEGGHLEALRILSEKNERLEIWIGWSGRRWQYQTRLVPTRTAMRHLKRMFPNQWHRTAPAYMQEKPESPESHVTLRKLVLGELHPFSKRVQLADGTLASFAGGDVFRIPLSGSGSMAARGEPVQWWSWYAVSALMNGPRVQFSNLLYASLEISPFRHLKSDNVLEFAVQKADSLACLLGLPAAEEYAASKGYQPTPKQDDSSSHPAGRGSRVEREPGEADLGLTQDSP